MKSPILASVVMLSAVTAGAQSRFVTLYTGTNRPTDQLTIGTNEAANIVSVGARTYYLAITKENFKTEFNPSAGLDLPPKTLITGPATVTLGFPNQPAPNYSSYATIEIIPESFPPDKTIIIPADTKGANILMEASADLIHWTNAPPGLYTNSPSSLFFRLRAGRIP